VAEYRREACDSYRAEHPLLKLPDPTTHITPTRPTVFLVDREHLYRWFATESLSRSHINVLASASIAEAAGYLRASGNVDLLIVDANLLDGGIGPLGTLREWSRAKLLILDSDGDLSRKAWGDVAIAPKPDDSSALLSLVSAHLSSAA
jgi:DNA-binding response OmpR family regulator